VTSSRKNERRLEEMSSSKRAQQTTLRITPQSGSKSYSFVVVFFQSYPQFIHRILTGYSQNYSQVRNASKAFIFNGLKDFSPQFLTEIGAICTYPQVHLPFYPIKPLNSTPTVPFLLAAPVPL
jgi:hypothetical protein